jgi:hypothetical protein
MLGSNEVLRTESDSGRLNTPGIVQRHPELRWLASLAVLGAVGTLVVSAVSGVFRDERALPTTSATELVARVRTPHSGGYSGTVVTRIDLGLPETLRTALAEGLPVGGNLLDGSHTMRYWYGGATQQRCAVVEQNAEQDVFRNGETVLLWDTRQRTMQRGKVDSSAGPLPLAVATPAALAPPQLADRLLALVGGHSRTALRSGDRIADRSTYELVVTPATTGSLVDSVHIEVDGAHSVPLGVQVYTRGSHEPAIDVSFTTVRFAAPAARNFTFTPPDGTRASAVSPFGLLAGASELSTTGSGWRSVAAYEPDPLERAVLTKLLGPSLRRVHGSWGTGQLFRSPLLTVLITDPQQAKKDKSGRAAGRDVAARVLAGAVAPSVLYRTVGR